MVILFSEKEIVAVDEKRLLDVSIRERINRRV